MTEQPSTPVVDHPKGTHVQDPSPLVIQLVQREITHQSDLRTSEIEGLRREIVTRLEGMDKALLKVEQIPTDMDRAIARVRELFEEKFSTIGVSLCEREKRNNQRDDANKELLGEQRASSQDAVNKAEGAMLREIETLTVAIRDMKERLDRTEGKTEGAVWLWGTILGAIVVISGAIGTVMVVIAS